jgi:proteasome accessory factor B
VSNQKTERLINLTLALLASKRYLTKSEIFNTVAGYQGSLETMERMFERDKDELRGLGIDIEVKGIDPLFEDEQGYLIQEDSFQIKADAFSKEEVLYLTMAANLWHGSALHNQAKSALLKIQSLNGPTETDDVNLPVIKNAFDSDQLALVFEAMRNHNIVEFTYKGEIRRVKPYGLYTRDGFWYLVGEEHDLLKNFKLIRITKSLVIASKSGAFTKPESFDLNKFIQDSQSSERYEAVLMVKKNQALDLRKKFPVRDVDDEWDQMSCSYSFEEEFIQSVLWHGSNVVILSPEFLQKKLIAKCRQLING